MVFFFITVEFRWTVCKLIMAEGRYNLRSRRKMVPNTPDLLTQTPPSDHTPSVPQHKAKSSNVIELKGIIPQGNGHFGRGEGDVYIGSEEEETVFEQTSLTQPLLSEESPSDGETRVKESEVQLKEKDEGSFSIALQVFIPYIIAGFGTVGAGMVLDVVQVRKIDTGNMHMLDIACSVSFV